MWLTTPQTETREFMVLHMGRISIDFLDSYLLLKTHCLPLLPHRPMGFEEVVRREDTRNQGKANEILSWRSLCNLDSTGREGGNG